MFRILIVEDEKIERETLADILTKRVAGCDEVLSAKNGQVAMELFHEFHPQLVCADINLPGMNGLEMIQRMQQEYPDTQYLILSSYNYFEYAQQAIRLGVNDFILKPYNITEFVEVIHKIIDKIKSSYAYTPLSSHRLAQMTPMLEKECVYAIVSNEPELELRRRVHLLDEQLATGCCFVISEDNLDVEAITACIHAHIHSGYLIHASIHAYLICFLLYPKGKEVLPKELFALFDGLKPYDAALGIGPYVQDIAEYYRSFLLARERVGRKLDVQEQLSTFERSEDNSERLYRAAECFIKTLEKSDEDLFKKELQIYTDELMKHDADFIVQALQTLYQDFMALIQKQYTNIDLSQFQLLPLQASANIHQELHLNLNLNLKKMYHLIEDERFRNTNHLVKEALHYIDQNYHKQIVLADLADYLRVSPYHISRLLSTSLHKSFTELVAKKRVEASKVLLKRDERIKEIAGAVGFQGQSYFNKIFKKYTGMTPKEYRNKMKLG